jgi:hypothetical protein
MTIDFFGFTDLAESVAVTDDGKLVVAGQARDDVDGYGVARLFPQEAGSTGSWGRRPHDAAWLHRDAAGQHRFRRSPAIRDG